MTITERFWSHVSRSDGCWIWTAGCVPYGYGTFWIGNKPVLAHRASWEFANGQIENGLCVLHKCDNPPCVRPDHLFLGTRADNTADRDRKGRGRWTGAKNPPRGNDHWVNKRPGCRVGAKNPRTKLTDADVLAMRERLSRGETCSAIAREYGIGYVGVWMIKTRRNWRHLP